MLVIRRASYCMLAAREIISTQCVGRHFGPEHLLCLDDLRVLISQDCSVTSTPNQLGFVDTCLSLPHAKGRDQGYFWRGAYIGNNFALDHIF